MKRPNSDAAARTLNLCDVREQQNLAPPIVETGRAVKRVALAHDGELVFCWHFAIATTKTLCGLLFAKSQQLSDSGNLGTCQECRAEASKLRAVVI